MARSREQGINTAIQSLRPEGEVRLFLRWACSDLKRLIGDFEGEYFLFSLLKSHRDVCHGVGPFCLWVAVASPACLSARADWLNID